MKPKKILVVEDSPSIRKTLALNLEQAGFEVVQAVDGQAGLDAALSQSFDLIISDVEMPRMNGLDFCIKLKEDTITRGLPVIILSSLDKEPDIDKGFHVGAAAYIPKSEASTLLLDSINKVLDKSSFNRKNLILVVDDSATIRNIVEKALGEAGFQIMTAENGEKALELMEIRLPDLILSDIDMPKMNGIEFCSRVNRHSGWASIPFIFMSANSDRAIMLRMLQRGASAYMVKPFNIVQLVFSVEKLLSDHFLLLLKEKERLDTERRMMLGSITSLIEALEARDAYTRGHSDAVSMLMVEMGKMMNLSEEDIEALRIGGRLHDLGKIGVRDNVLLKEEALSASEFLLIKKHPKIGAEILGSIPTLKNIIPIILHHHEKFDGSGYPDGLKGTQIPLWARICAVADIYHALTSDRPYRKGMPETKALQIINSERGKGLCPTTVDVFLKWVAQKQAKNTTP